MGDRKLGPIPTHEREFTKYRIALCARPYGKAQTRGTPVSAYPPGTWIVCSPDKSILDFAKRGELRRCLNDWFGAIENDGQRRQYNERFGVPFVDFASDNAQERDTAQAMMANFGSTGGLVHRLTGSALKFSDGARPTASRRAAPTWRAR